MPSLPQQIGEYSVICELSPSASYLCRDGRGRQVVLKRLESDCLLRGQLHPSIRDRLSRVRELALTNVATLQGVDRVDGEGWLIWEHVDGQTLEEAAGSTSITIQPLSLLVRELILSLESLHAQGIVHGGVHGRNVIVGSGGEIRLTHISPLLYNDPADDAAAVVALIRDLLTRRSEETSDLGRYLAAVDPRQCTLSQLATAIAVPAAGRAEVRTSGAGADPENRVRHRATAAAMLLAILGVVTALVIYRAVVPRASAVAPSHHGTLDSIPLNR